MTEIILELIFLVLVGAAAITDLRFGKIKKYMSELTLVPGTVLLMFKIRSFEDLLWAVGSFAVLLIIWYIANNKKMPFGAADVIIMTATMLALGSARGLYAIFAGLVISIIFFLITRRKEIRIIPFLFIGDAIFIALGGFLK